jgi:hypothetical protein
MDGVWGAGVHVLAEHAAYDLSQIEQLSEEKIVDLFETLDIQAAMYEPLSPLPPRTCSTQSALVFVTQMHAQRAHATPHARHALCCGISSKLPPLNFQYV